ncbi:hypothetical protein PF004_g13046 [Phytophthora fragariae]|uniref:CCHC-type domain-containing protein n=1 Tax=Phytophthora fragariae TaxID=53985 RepID=A0A6G0NTI7_9STRA|nr:hypothetical protein PF004_g13046 [Phytophthora fragariae]
MMLDTGNGGQVELEVASVRMASENTPPPRQPDDGSRVADQTTTPSRTANVVTRDQGDDEGPRTVRFTGDPPPRQPAARPSITSHDDDQQDDDTDGFVEYAGSTAGNTGSHACPRSKAQPSSSRVNQPTTVNRGPRGDDGGGLQGRRHGRMLQVEAQGGDRAPLGVHGGASRYGPQPPQSRQPLNTKEERLANHRRYQASRQQPATSARATDERVCYYCRNAGHFARECRLKAQDLASGREDADKNDAMTTTQADDAGNAQRASRKRRKGRDQEGEDEDEVTKRQGLTTDYDEDVGRGDTKRQRRVQDEESRSERSTPCVVRVPAQKAQDEEAGVRHDVRERNEEVTPPLNTGDGARRVRDGATNESKLTQGGCCEAPRPERKGLSEYTGPLPRRQREVTQVMRVGSSREGPPVQNKSVNAPKERNPVQLMAAVLSEMKKGDAQHAKVLQARAVADAIAKSKDAEAERWAARATKRRERTRRRRAAKEKSDHQEQQDAIVTAQDVASATSKRSEGMRDGECPAPGRVKEQQFVMPEPDPDFREAMMWSIRARDALREVEIRGDALTEGFGKLATSKAERLELLAAGNVVGENDTRDGVAQQLVAAATGLRAIARDDWVDKEETPLQVSRAIRRFEKRVRKARAKVRRQQQVGRDLPYNERDTFVAMDELHRGGRAHARHLTREEAEAAELVLPYATEALKKRKHRRKRQRVYDYHSGSHYQEPVLGRSRSTPELNIASLVGSGADMAPSWTC